MSQYARYFALSGSGGAGVSSVNTLTGALTLSPGAGITITPSGSTLTIAATGSSPVGDDNTVAFFNSSGALSDDTSFTYLESTKTLGLVPLVMGPNFVSYVGAQATAPGFLVSGALATAGQIALFGTEDIPAGTTTTPEVDVSFQSGAQQDPGNTNLTGNIYLLTGDNLGTGANGGTGFLFITTGTSFGGGDTGPVLFTSGNAEGTSNTGSMFVNTGPISNVGPGGGSTGDFVFQSGDVQIGNGSSGVASFSSGFAGGNGNTGNLSVASGPAEGTGISGDVSLQTGATTSATSGQMALTTGIATSGSSGPANISTGATSGSNPSGEINVITGATTSGATGNLSLFTGGSTGAGTGDVLINSGNGSTFSGPIQVVTGNASAGNSGTLLIRTGTASGSRGLIQLQNGSEGTAGQVWTSTDTGGSGSWAASTFNASASQTTLTGIAGTAICSQPFTGSSYKKVIVYLNGYTDTGTQTYTFPTPFVNTPFVYGLAGGVSGATVTSTTIKFTTTLLSGFVFVEGY